MAAIEKLHLLATYLRVIERAEGAGDYDSRNGAVIQSVALALRMGFAAGFRIDPSEPEWPVAYSSFRPVRCPGICRSTRPPGMVIPTRRSTLGVGHSLRGTQTNGE